MGATGASGTRLRGFSAPVDPGQGCTSASLLSSRHAKCHLRCRCSCAVTTAGPRYTSYPTAPQFHAGFGECDLRAARRAERGSDPAPAVGLRARAVLPEPVLLLRLQPHHHARHSARRDAISTRLYREIELIAPLFDRDRDVAPAAFRRRHAELPRRDADGRSDGLAGAAFLVRPSREREFSHRDRSAPRATRTTSRMLAALRLQPRLASACRTSIRRCRRPSTASRASNRRARARCRRARSGFRSINVDLIYGLPKQTPARFARTLDQRHRAAARTASPSTATRTCRSCFKAQRQIDAADLPDAGNAPDAAAAWRSSSSRAPATSISAWTTSRCPSDDLAQAQERGTLQRNFQGYSTHADCDLIGLGVSAISHVGDSFSQNPRDLPATTRARRRPPAGRARGMRLDDDDCMRADVIQQLMCHGVIDDCGVRNGATGSTSTSISPSARQTSRRWSTRRTGRARRRPHPRHARADACCCASSPCASTATSPARESADPRHATRTPLIARVRRVERDVNDTGAGVRPAQSDRRRRRRRCVSARLARSARSAWRTASTRRALHDLHCWSSTSARYHAGELVFRKGEPFAAIFAVRAGMVKTRRDRRDGREQVLGFHLPGEIIGLNAIHAAKYPCDAVALDTVMLCRFSFPALATLATRMPGVQQQLFRLLSQDIGKAALLAGDYSADERMAAFLVGSVATATPRAVFRPTALPAGDVAQRHRQLPAPGLRDRQPRARVSRTTACSRWSDASSNWSAANSSKRWRRRCCGSMRRRLGGPSTQRFAATHAAGLMEPTQPTRRTLIGATSIPLSTPGRGRPLDLRQGVDARGHRPCCVPYRRSP